MQNFRLACVLFVCAFALAACATAQQPQVAGLGGVINAGISVGDARMLAARHNLTGYKPLPPGIRKNLARGKPLPPGIAKTRLPQPFVAELPHYPGYEWRQAGTDLLLVVSGSYLVQDVLNGVFE